MDHVKALFVSLGGLTSSNLDGVTGTADIRRLMLALPPLQEIIAKEKALRLKESADGTGVSLSTNRYYLTRAWRYYYLTGHGAVLRPILTFDWSILIYDSRSLMLTFDSGHTYLIGLSLSLSRPMSTKAISDEKARLSQVDRYMREMMRKAHDLIHAELDSMDVEGRGFIESEVLRAVIVKFCCPIAPKVLLHCCATTLHSVNTALLCQHNYTAELSYCTAQRQHNQNINVH